MDATTIPNASGIYRIVHVTTGRMYIGSAVNLHQRQRDHFSALRRDGHPNAKLQHAFNKYGQESFAFEILELVLVPEMLTAREQYWFDKLKPFGRKGFNLVLTAGSNLGMKVSSETREKLRVSHLGQPGHWTGKKRSPETIEKIRLAKVINPGGRPLGCEVSPEHREKLRLANLGKKQSEETRRKAGDARRGKPRSPETREKIRLAKLGHTVSEDTIAKIRAKNHQVKTLIVIAPDGTEQTIHGIRKFCKEHDLDRSTLLKVAQGRTKQHKGWTAHYP